MILYYFILFYIIYISLYFSGSALNKRNLSFSGSSGSFGNLTKNAFFLLFL